MLLPQVRQLLVLRNLLAPKIEDLGSQSLQFRLSSPVRNFAILQLLHSSKVELDKMLDSLQRGEENENKVKVD